MIFFMNLLEILPILCANREGNLSLFEFLGNCAAMLIGPKNLIACIFCHKSERTHTSTRDARDVDIHRYIISQFRQVSYERSLCRKLWRRGHCRIFEQLHGHCHR